MRHQAAYKINGINFNGARRTAQPIHKTTIQSIHHLLVGELMELFGGLEWICELLFFSRLVGWVGYGRQQAANGSAQRKQAARREEKEWSKGMKATRKRVNWRNGMRAKREKKINWKLIWMELLRQWNGGKERRPKGPTAPRQAKASHQSNSFHGRVWWLLPRRDWFFFLFFMAAGGHQRKSNQLCWFVGAPLAARELFDFISFHQSIH